MLIGYYVHHQGAGHLERARAVISRLSCRAAVLTQVDVPDDAFGPDVEIVALPPDTPAREDDVDAGGALHWAPLDVDVAAPRVATIASWVESRRPDLLVTDVSVEVTVLARLLGVPTAVVRLHGTRTDRAHLLAFDCASTIVAPFPQALEDPATDPALARRTFYAGVISRHEDPVRNEVHRTESVPSSAVIVWGRGGAHPSVDDLIAMARACPDWTWQYVGPGHRVGCVEPNLEICGWVGGVHDLIARAEVVVGAAGNGTIAAVTRARRPFICLPQPRPFDEQLTTARQLRRLGIAEVAEHWPHPTEWQRLLDEARVRRPDAMARMLPINNGDLFAQHLERAIAARQRSIAGKAPAPRSGEL